jgi:hypothetical protein
MMYIAQRIAKSPLIIRMPAFRLARFSDRRALRRKISPISRGKSLRVAVVDKRRASLPRVL